FNDNLQLVKDHIVIKLEELGTDLTGEQLSNKDLTKLYDLVKKMSTDIAQLLKNQEDNNKEALEKEIEKELLETIKKSKIYGKKEVFSNLIGKFIYLRNELTSNLLNKGFDDI